jgi:hypothetical protein
MNSGFINITPKRAEFMKAEAKTIDLYRNQLNGVRVAKVPLFAGTLPKSGLGSLAEMVEELERPAMTESQQAMLDEQLRIAEEQFGRPPTINFAADLVAPLSSLGPKPTPLT